MNPNLVADLGDITNKELSELTFLGIVSPISKNSQLEVATWVKLYKDLTEKHSLRWIDQSSFTDLYLSRYPYYTPAFSRKLTVKDKKYWMVFNKDYFALLNLSDKTLENLSMFDDRASESFWFEYNKLPELTIATSNIAVNQHTGIGEGFKQQNEYWRTWVTDEQAKIDFSPGTISFYPQLTNLSGNENTVVENTSGVTTVGVSVDREFVYWPFAALGVILVLLYALQKRR